MSIQFAEKLKTLRQELDAVKQQIAELQKPREHVHNCERVTELVNEVEKRKPGRPRKNE